jgi:hypothetical protein
MSTAIKTATLVAALTFVSISVAAPAFAGPLGQRGSFSSKCVCLFEGQPEHDITSESSPRSYCSSEQSCATGRANNGGGSL